MLNKMFFNPYEALVQAQYGTLLNYRSLDQKVKDPDKKFKRFLPNVQKTQLQDPHTFNNWWQFFANGQKPNSYLELQRQRIANRRFADQIKDRNANKFLNIIGKHEPKIQFKIVEQLSNEFLKSFQPSNKQEKQRLAQKSGKSLNAHATPKLPQSQVKKFTIITNKSTHKPKQMKQKQKSILRNQLSLMKENLEKESSEIYSKDSSMIQYNIFNEKLNDNLDKKPSEIHDETLITKQETKPAKKSNEQLIHLIDELLNEEPSEIYAKKSNEKLNKLTSENLNKKSSEIYKGKSNMKLYKMPNNMSNKKQSEILSGTQSEISLRNENENPNDMMNEELDVKQTDMSHITLIVNESHDKVAELTDEQLDEMLYNNMINKQDNTLEEESGEEQHDEELPIESIVKKRRQSRIKRHLTAIKSEVIGKSRKRKASVLSRRSQSMHSILSLDTEDFAHVPMRQKSKGRVSKFNKNSINKSRLNTISLPKTSSYRFEKFARYRKLLHREQLNLSKPSSITLLQPRISSTSSVASRISTLLPLGLTPTVIVPHKVENDAPKREQRKHLSAASSVIWKMSVLSKGSDEEMNRNISKIYPPLNVKKHINLCLTAKHFELLHYHSTPQNWPIPFESLLVQRLRRMIRKLIKQKKMLARLDTQKVEKKVIKLKGKVRKKQSITTASCEICSSFENTEPDQPYMAEMKKRQQRYELMKYYRCRLLPAARATMQPKPEEVKELQQT